MTESKEYTFDEIQQMAAIARRDQLAGLYRDEAARSENCSCGWRAVLSRQQIGWSGTWCRSCAVADRLHEADRLRFQLHKTTQEAERLRAMIVEWIRASQESLDDYDAACTALRLEGGK